MGEAALGKTAGILAAIQVRADPYRPYRLRVLADAALLVTILGAVAVTIGALLHRQAARRPTCDGPS
jgi:hypothetical protein